MKYAPFTVTQAHLDFLREKRISHSVYGDDRGWLKVGARYSANWDCEVEPYSCQRTGPYFNSLGAFSYSRSLFAGIAHFGRYCSVGELVKVMSPSHPLSRVGTCGFDYADAGPYNMLIKDRASDFKRTPLPGSTYTAKTIIGHDVWIGNEARIARGITIGTGAVVAAYSVVTRDVEPYTLVAGNPARPKKRRFPDELCDRLMTSEWWRYAFTDFARMDTLNPEIFLDQLDAAVTNGDIQPFEPAKIDLHRNFARISAEEAAKTSAHKAPVKTFGATTANSPKSRISQLIRKFY